MNFDCGVYAITSPSGKQYIGSAKSFKQRWYEHQRQLRKGIHTNQALQRAFLKYGESALVFSKIAFCAETDLKFREQEQIDSRPRAQLYNVCTVVERPFLGFTHTDEAKAKIVAAHIGRPKSPQQRAKTSAALKGRPRTESALLGMRGKMKSTNTSGYPCVSRTSEGTWLGRFRVAGKCYNAGTFSTPSLADAAVRALRASLATK